MDGLSRALLPIVDAAEKIAIDQPEGDDIAFLDGLLCTVGLPRSRVSGNVFERTSGRAALRVEAGQLWNGRKWVRQIVPYGPIPRLIARVDLYTSASLRIQRDLDRKFSIRVSTANRQTRFRWPSESGSSCGTSQPSCGSLRLSASIGLVNGQANQYRQPSADRAVRSMGKRRGTPAIPLVAHADTLPRVLRPACEPFSAFGLARALRAGWISIGARHLQLACTSPSQTAHTGIPAVVRTPRSVRTGVRGR